MDGAGLTEALHARGINVRYLGRVAGALKPHAHLAYLHAIAVGELVLRAAKHVYTAYLQVCDCTRAAAARRAVPGPRSRTRILPTCTLSPWALTNAELNFL